MTGASNRNWFLHLGYYRPHPPFIAPEPYNTMYDPAAMAPPVRAATAGAAAASHPLHKFYIDNINQRGFFQGADGLGSAMDEEAVRVMRATYFGLMPAIDDHLGRVFDFLKHTGQWDDTLIVFTSD